MSDWVKQVTELQQSWVAQQQQLLQDWLGSLKNEGDSSLQANWRKATEVMEAQVKNALDTQTRSLLACVENLEGMDGVPDDAAKALTQTKANLRKWAEMQAEVWKALFDTLRESAPALQMPGEATMKRWQELIQKSMSIQDKWLAK